MPPLVASLLRRSPLVYGFLLIAWVIIAAWLAVEHSRVKTAAQSALVNRSRDIATTLGLVIRAQQWRGAVLQERVESALTELVRSGELLSVALLNATGGVVASAGPPIDLETKKMIQTGEQWHPESLTIFNLVDLGDSVSREGETNAPTIVLPRPEDAEFPETELARRYPGRERTSSSLSNTNGSKRERDNAAFTTTASGGSANESPALGESRPPPLPNEERRGFGRRSDLRYTRPPWMSEAEHKAFLERRGLHGLVISLSTDSLLVANRQDLWMRGLIGCFATVSVLGLGLAWRNLTRSSQLQLRLLRASEFNTHLKEMNLAAAGLAHETRNPLNIIRGLAQMISKQQDAASETRKKSVEIIAEADRVTAQLNEFINYTRPRELRRAPTRLQPVIAEVARALTYDLEEKEVQFHVPDSLPVIEADEQLLRQALFNLLINAIQAVHRGGHIEIAAWKQNGPHAILEIRDDGPGVSPEQRAEIFKPYFTTHQKGTGLGLAVVQQIALAHGWDIECLPNEPRGAIFRISHIRA